MSTPVPELTNPRSLNLERFPIRSREGGNTEAGWRLAVSCDEGEGAITLVEAVPGGAVYRGEGVFLGWSQDRLASAYVALRPPDETPPLETQQLG